MNANSIYTFLKRQELFFLIKITKLLPPSCNKSNHLAVYIVLFCVMDE
jgi:hypothetical protein